MKQKKIFSYVLFKWLQRKFVVQFSLNPDENKQTKPKPQISVDKEVLHSSINIPARNLILKKPRECFIDYFRHKDHLKAREANKIVLLFIQYVKVAIKSPERK